MFKLVLIVVAAVMAWSMPSSAQSVDSWIDVNGTGSYFYEEHHPTKFDFSTMTFCGGRNSDSKSGSFSVPNQRRTGSAGKWDVYMDVGAEKGILSSLINQQLEWNSSFDLKEYTFNVRLKKRRGSGYESTQRNTCNTRTWRYAVDAARSKFFSSVRVVIPENVYVARIRTRTGGVANITTKIEKVMPIVSNRNAPEYGEGIILENGISYFFVKPQDEISVQVFNDSSGDVDLIADFEITFMGKNRCETGLSEFKQLAGAPADESLSREVVSAAFKMVEQGLFRADSSGEAFHKAILFIGCLTGEKVISSLIYDNNPRQVEMILDGIDDFANRARRINDSDRANGVAAKNALVLGALDLMARNAVSTSVLQGMRPLCSRYPFVGQSGKIEGHITGYLVFRNQLDLMAQTLKLEPQNPGAISRYFRGLLQALKQMEGHTYGDLIRVRRAELESLVDDYVNNKKLSLVDEAARQFDLLPGINPSRDIVGMSQELKLMRQKVYRVNEEFHRQIDLFAANSAAAIDVSRFAASIEDFAKAEERFSRHFFRTYEVFSEDYASSFGVTMANLNDRHVTLTRRLLNQRYGGFLAKFADFQKRKLDGDNVAQELAKCIQHPVSSNN